MATTTATPSFTSLSVSGTTAETGNITWSKPSVPSGATITSCVLTGTVNISTTKGTVTATINGTNYTSTSSFSVDLGTSNNTTSLTVSAKGANKNSTGTVSMSNLLYTVTYTQNYIVTFKNWDGSTINSYNSPIDSLFTIPPEPSRSGYRFVGWNSGDNIFTTAELQVMTPEDFGGDVTFTAQYISTENMRIINSSCNNGGTITPNGTFYVDSGASQEFTINANYGYKLQTLTVNDVEVIPTKNEVVSTPPENSISLLHCESLSDSLENTIVTNYGATVDNSIYKFGRGSLYFNADNENYLKIYLGSAKASTIEMWIYMLDSDSNLYPTIFSSEAAKWNGGTYIHASNGTTSEYPEYRANPSTSTSYVTQTGSTIITKNEWHHIALCVDGNYHYFFLDGVLQATLTQSSPNDYGAWYIGGLKKTSMEAGCYFNGYIDEILISSSCKWTSNFTVPTEPYKDATDVSYVYKYTCENITSNTNVVATFKEAATHIVTFLDWNGTILKTQMVADGESATPPPDPTRALFTFTGWDIGYTNVTSDITVTAQYTVVVVHNTVRKIRIGSTVIDNLFIGSTQINKMYLGDKLLYDNTSILDDTGAYVIDDFSGDNVDLSKWKYELGNVRNNELQVYTSTNTEVSDGILQLKGLKDSDGNWTSSSIISHGNFSFMYGKIEARIKMCNKAGAFGAFWTLGDTFEFGYKETGSPDTLGEWWPNCGEFDITEFYNNQYTVGAICSDADNLGRVYTTDYTFDDWHVYAMEWTEDGNLKFLIDDNVISETGATNNQAFHMPHYILLNQAIGGSGGTPDSSTTEIIQYIDYVKYYPLSADNLKVNTEDFELYLTACNDSDYIVRANFKDNSINKALAWSSSDESIVKIYSGLVSVQSSTASGNVIITATSKAGVSKTIQLTLSSGSITNIVLNNIDNISAIIGESFNITYTTNVAAVKHEISYDGETYTQISPTTNGTTYTYTHSAITDSANNPINIYIKVTDSNGNTSTRSFLITVVDDPLSFVQYKRLNNGVITNTTDETFYSTVVKYPVSARKSYTVNLNLANYVVVCYYDSSGNYLGYSEGNTDDWSIKALSYTFTTLANTAGILICATSDGTQITATIS